MSTVTNHSRAFTRDSFLVFVVRRVRLSPRRSRRARWGKKNTSSYLRNHIHLAEPGRECHKKAAPGLSADVFQFRMFSKIEFYLSWWAYSFSMDALVIGTLLMYHESGLPFFKTASWVLFVLLNGITLMLSAKTIRAVRRRTICVEEVE